MKTLGYKFFSPRIISDKIHNSLSTLKLLLASEKVRSVNCLLGFTWLVVSRRRNILVIEFWLTNLSFLLGD